MSNLHTPERLPGETTKQYRQRRARSGKSLNGRMLFGYRPSAERTNRRAGVKAAGGILQYKRAQYRAKGWL